jgi:hypothetical protein
VLQDYCPDLLDLIGLGVSPLALQVHTFFDSRSSEQMVTSPCSLLETKIQEQAAEIVEIDVGVRATAEQLRHQLLASRHAVKVTTANA